MDEEINSRFNELKGMIQAVSELVKVVPDMAESFEQIQERVKHLREMVQAVSELVKNVPILESRLDEVMETVEKLKGERQEPPASGASPSVVSEEELERMLRPILERFTGMVEGADETMKKREEAIIQGLNELQALLKTAQSRGGASGGTGGAGGAGLPAGELIEKIEDLRRITGGQYSEIKSLLSDIEMNILSGQEKVSRMIKREE